MRVKEVDGVKIPISRFVIYPDRVEGHRRRHDIGLLEFNNTLKFNNSIRPACFTNHPPKAGTRCWATGWGTSRKGGELHQIYISFIVNCYRTMLSFIIKLIRFLVKFRSIPKSVP